MSDHKTPAIGHVTPATGEPTRIADDRAWEALAGRVAAPLPPNVITYPLSALWGMDEEPGTVEAAPSEVRRRPPYGETGAPFELESARALLANTEHVDPSDRADYVATDLWVELRLACDEVERLEREVKLLRATVEAEANEHIACAEDLRQANARCDAIGEERDVARNALEIAQHSIEALQGQHIEALQGLRDRLYITAHSLGANLPVPTERSADDAVLRIEFRVADLQRAHATLERSRDRWQAKAKRASARVAAMTQERDGLTLRLGAKERRRVQRGVKAKPGSVVRRSRWRHRKTGRIAVVKPSDRGRGWVAYRYESGHRYARDLTLTCTVTRGRFLATFEPMDGGPARTRKAGRP